MPGPLPNPTRRRRNAPTIPTTNLPAGGRKGVAPRPPAGYDLGARAKAWWQWAWKTPQAAGWSAGDLYVIARRAQLEDDLAVLECEGLGPVPDTSADCAEYLENVRFLVSHLKGLAASKLAVSKEARELDDRLGLTPKGMAALRWKIVDGAEGEEAKVRPLRAVPEPPAADPRRLLG